MTDDHGHDAFRQRNARFAHFAHYQPDTDRVEALVEAAEELLDHRSNFMDGSQYDDPMASLLHLVDAVGAALANLRPEAKP